MNQILPGPIFISHATKDDAFVKKLRRALEGHQVKVWVDSRNLRGGSKLNTTIETAIETAQHTLVVLSPDTANSRWVRKEIKKSLEVEKASKNGYRTIPILLPGIEPAALALWFEEEPVAIPIGLDPGNLQEAMPAILAALGLQLPNDTEAAIIKSNPVAELLLELADPSIKTSEGETRAIATATISFAPDTKGFNAIRSRRFAFKSPFGPIEFDKLTWYLEDYYTWPVGVFKDRAEKIEQSLPELGQALFEATLNHPEAQTAVTAWKAYAKDHDLQFSIMVDRELPIGKEKEAIGAAEKAATILSSIPWELLHDEAGYLAQGKTAIGIKRRLPNRKHLDISKATLPIRILLVSARPEDERAGYIDHRASAKPLITAVENLGSELVTLTVCAPATFPAMIAAIKKAEEAGTPFDVIHFDGHGIYNERTGLGALCFEDPVDIDKIAQRKSKLVDAETIGKSLNEYRIPLMFLEACQTAKTEDQPTASVAATLLEKGITSVIAMTHSVLVKTAARFVETFYSELAKGARVGKAVLDAQTALALDVHRGTIAGAGVLELQDWFVPVLYQEKDDPQLFTKIATASGSQLNKKQRKYSLGKVAEQQAKISHAFVGRSRQLLAIERLLNKANYATVRGQGGAGKTTIAVELAHWLVQTERFQKAAFVSVEHLSSIQPIINEIAEQIVPSFSAQEQSDPKKAMQAIQRALLDDAIIIVFDNLESILPDPSKKEDALSDEKFIESFFNLCQFLVEPPKTRLVFTTREKLPTPFAQNEVRLGALSQKDAIQLVSDILKQNGQAPPANDSGNTPEEIENLVNAVNCHARALVLLTNEVATRGVLHTTENIKELMAAIHQKFPANREKSLYASLELSLRRLPEEVREQLKVLALFEGGVHLVIWTQLLKLEKTEEIRDIAAKLINVGLAEAKEYGHLQLDPALPSYMHSSLSEEEKNVLLPKWAEAMNGLVHYLYSQMSRDAKIAARLSIMELPNLFNLLAYIKDHYSPEKIVSNASKIEQLIANLHQPKALQRVVQIRTAASKNIKAWSSATFEAERMKIERFLGVGNLQAAFDTSQKLLQRSLEEGEAAYAGAAYNLAMSFKKMGDVLDEMGSSKPAIDFFEQAIIRFEKLTKGGDKGAERMLSKSLTGKADCLADLGRLEEAETTYKRGLKISKRLDDKRSVAIKNGQLGTVYMYQKKYKEAIEVYETAKNIFEEFGEFKMLSVAYHQLAMVYQKTNNFKAAEKTYRKSLAIAIKIKNKKGEADTLTQLGLLYNKIGFLEEAVVFFRQACDIAIELNDLKNEGLDRNNLAHILIQLKCYPQAREEIQRAIECKSQFGHASEPWKSFEILYNLEIATGNLKAAENAWQKAYATYLSYRKDGGYGQSRSAEIVATFKKGIEDGTIGELEAMIQQYEKMDLVAADKLFVSKLKLVLAGNRDKALAQDTGLYYADAVELTLLLADLGE